MSSSTVTEAAPAVTAVAVESARVYDVAGAPALPDATGQLFEPNRLRVWDRLHGAWCVVVYGPLADGTERRTARVFAPGRDTELPEWARPYLLGPRTAQGEAGRLLKMIADYARDYASDWGTSLDEVEAQRANIERELVALATAAELGTGQPGQPHILVRQIDRGADRKQALDAQIRGVEDPEEAVCLLMMVVERITGVRGDSYMHLVDAVRAVAARERDRDHAGLSLNCDLCGGPCEIDRRQP